MMGYDLDKKHYPYASEEDRQKKKDVAYIVFNLDKEQTEEVFASYSWHTKNLDLKQGDSIGEAVPS